MDEAIHFLVALGSPPAGSKSLMEYLRDVAGVDELRLAGLPPSVSQQGMLSHVRLLFIFAEERLLVGGGVAAAQQLLPGVLSRYRAELPLDLREALLNACARCIELESTMPVLRDLLTGALSDESASCSVGESLSQYLIYEDADLEQQQWFIRNFPPGLRLEHALEAFRLMVEATR